MSINGNTINYLAALDEEFYQLWLRDPSASLIYLVHIDYIDNYGSYPFWTKYTLKLSDYPFQGHLDRIKSVGTFTRQIGDKFTGAITASIGDVDLDNSDGRLDLWHKLAFDGQTVRVLVGDPSWSEDRFRLAYECVAEIAASSTYNTLTIRLRGLEYKANTPIQTNTVGSATVNSTANSLIPIAYGKVFNVTPVLIDNSSLIYQWNDGPVTSVSDVRDGGVNYSTGQKVISVVSGNLITTSTSHGFYSGTRVRDDTGSLPVVTIWTGIAWNGSVFCAVAQNSNIAATSPDGIFWTQRALPVTANWGDIAWNGSVFCAITADSTIAATSPDGIFWTQRALPIASNWSEITWNGSVFCVIDLSSISLTSPDGISWTQHTKPTGTYWYPLVWNGSVFCSINSTSAITSPDGINWTQSTLSFPAGSWSAMAWNGSVFCALRYGSNGSATSPDGLNWTSQTLPSVANWRDITWNGSVFCAVSYGSSGVSLTSPDGITWTSHTMPTVNNWRMAWNGSIFCVPEAYSDKVATSTDGATWLGSFAVLPTPLEKSTDYWVIPDGLTSTSFKVSATRGGSAITLTNTTTGGALVGYHWTADLTTGKIQLDSKPAGVLTLDGISGNTDAANMIIQALSADNVDNESKVKFQSDCPQSNGIYITDRRNRIDVANEIAASVGAWYGYSRDGMLQFGRVSFIGSPIPDHYLTEDDVIFNTLQVESIIKQTLKIKVGYRCNWTEQTSGLFSSVSAENVELYKNKYSVSPASTYNTGTGLFGGFNPFHALAVLPDYYPTLLSSAADATAEAIRLGDLYGDPIEVYSFDAGKVGFNINIGDLVSVTHSRFGLDGVSECVMPCVSIEDNSKVTKLKLLRIPDASYFPGQLT